MADKHIVVSDETHAALTALLRGKDRYEDVIIRLMEAAKTPA